MTNSEMVSLLGRVALVTGSTSGIGLGIARALAPAGTHLVLNGFGDKAQIDRAMAPLAATTSDRRGFAEEG